MDNAQTIYDLLYHIQANYPIGIPELYDQPRLYSNRDKIVQQKFSLDQSQQITPWKELLTASTAGIGEVKDFGHRQFPGYMLKKEVFETTLEFNHIHFSREIILCVSLLCPYYTAFYNDEYTFNDVKSAHRLSVPTFRIVSQQVVTSEYNQEVSKLQSLLDLVPKYFPGYQFVQHSIVFKNTVTNGVRLEAQGSRGALPFFSYLFDDSFSLKNLEIQD